MRKSIMVPRGLVCLLVATVAFALAAPIRADEAEARKVAQRLGFSASDIKKIEAGEVVTHDQVNKSDKELALAVAMYLPVKMDKLIEAVQDGAAFKTDHDVLAFGEITADKVTAADLKGLQYTDKDVNELKALQKPKSGSKLNLSKQDIAALKAACKDVKSGDLGRKAEAREKVMDAYRAVLADRLNQYKEDGLNGIAAYDRGGSKESSPRRELTLATSSEQTVAKSSPLFYRSLSNYPHDGADGVKHQFFWIKQRTQKRSCSVLMHRMSYKDDRGWLIAERQIYAGHDYNSLQIVAGCLPVKDGTVVFYSNRTFTDQVAGFGGGLKRSIGRSQMAGKVVEQFKTLRKKVSGQ